MLSLSVFIWSISSHPQNVLFSIGSAFLYYVNHFKLYSSFCASHSKAQKVLNPSKYMLLIMIIPVKLYMAAEASVVRYYIIASVSRPIEPKSRFNLVKNNSYGEQNRLTHPYKWNVEMLSHPLTRCDRNIYTQTYNCFDKSQEYNIV